MKLTMIRLLEFFEEKHENINKIATPVNFRNLENQCKFKMV